MAFEFVGIELFSNYNLFANGLFGFGFQMLLWGLLIFVIYRPIYEKPFDKGLEVLLPAILISFIMNFMNFGSLITRLLVFIAILISIKYYSKMPWHPFIVLCFQFLSLIWIFYNAREFSLLLFFIYILYNFVNGQLIINRKKAKVSSNKS